MTAQKFKSLPICVHSMRHKKNRFKNFNHKNNIIMQCRKISRNKENPYSLNMADVTCVAVVCRVTACNLCWLQVSPLVRAENTPQGKNTPHTRNTPQGDPCCPHKTPLWCVEDNCKCETKEAKREGALEVSLGRRRVNQAVRSRMGPAMLLQVIVNQCLETVSS